MKTNLQFKVWLLALSLALAACSADTDNAQTITAATPSADSKPLEMVVYKSPSCGCCKEWVHYVEKFGFAVSTIDHDNVDAIKIAHGLTDPSLKSCHTAIVDGYVIEGHVPISDIERLLAERPAIVGLTAPGMPMLSPGMGSEEPKNYDVLAFDEKGKSSVYSSY